MKYNNIKINNLPNTHMKIMSTKESHHEIGQISQIVPVGAKIFPELGKGTCKRISHINIIKYSPEQDQRPAGD